jgi:hypothetical protein
MSLDRYLAAVSILPLLITGIPKSAAAEVKQHHVESVASATATPRLSDIELLPTQTSDLELSVDGMPFDRNLAQRSKVHVQIDGV